MASVKFFHFTSEKMVAAAMRMGIWGGSIPHSSVPDPKNLKRSIYKDDNRWQWITKVSDFIPLNGPKDPVDRRVLKGRKQEYRLTVELTGELRHNVIRWLDWAKKTPIPLFEDINLDLGNPAEWWIFGGLIPLTSITAVDRSPYLPRVSVTVNTDTKAANDALSDVIVGKHSIANVAGHD